MSLSIGDRVGPYEITGLLGAGGMGEVYKARDTRLDRTVAVKVLPEHVASDPILKQRFEREAKALAMLSHPHICPVFDVGQQRGVDFLVMEYLEGETLAHRLEKGALPLDQALRYASEIADALDKAHRQGIVHRDLKPGNIMLTKSGTKLLDFGLAKVRPAVQVGDAAVSAAPTVGASLSGTGTIVGTLQYMAPEQIEGREADRRTDIFAFGAVLYEMVTGKKAFDGTSQASLISAILKDEPRPMATLDPTTPPALDRIVRRCLAKDPDERWQDARDVEFQLQAIGETLQSLSAPAPPAAKRRERLAWALAAAALAVGGMAIPVTRYLLAPEPAVTRLDVVTPPTSDPFSFALSPDGRQLVFAATGDDRPRLWLRRLDETNARPLIGTEDGTSPFWAPDGGGIAFFAEGKLKRLDLATGQSQVLADAPDGRGGTWNGDGVIVFTGSLVGPLMRVMATGGPAVALTQPAPGQSHRWPQFLPDGGRLIFFAGFGEPQTRGVYVTSLDVVEPTHVLATDAAAAYAPGGHLVYPSLGALVARRFDPARATLTGDPIQIAQAIGVNTAQFRAAFSVSAAGVLAHRAATPAGRQLLWVDRTGKVLGTVGARDNTAVASPELSPDGRRVAVFRAVDGNVDTWLVDIDRSVSSRFTFDAAVDSFPLWAPDGRRLVFASNRNGTTNDLFEKPASGAGGEQPLPGVPQGQVPLAWSSDGRFVLCSVQQSNGESDLWVLPMTGDRKPFPVVQTMFDDVQGQFSPDGRWLAYASNQSGRYEIYVQSFRETAGQWQVSAAGGIYPRWRTDGRELFYVAPDGRLMAAAITIAADGRGLDPGAPVPLFPTRLATGTNIAQAGFGSKAQYAVAPDGRFLLNVTADDPVAPPITVVLNWTAALAR